MASSQLQEMNLGHGFPGLHTGLVQVCACACGLPSRYRTEGLDRCNEFHLRDRGPGIRTGQFPSFGAGEDDGSPTAGARVSESGSIGIDVEHRRSSGCWGPACGESELSGSDAVHKISSLIYGKQIATMNRSHEYCCGGKYGRICRLNGVFRLLSGRNSRCSSPVRRITRLALVCSAIPGVP